MENSGLYDFTWFWINIAISVFVILVTLIMCLAIGNIVVYFAAQIKLWRTLWAKPNDLTNNAIQMPSSSVESEIMEQQSNGNEYYDNSEYEITRDGYATRR